MQWAGHPSPTEDQRGFTPYTYAFGNVINTSDPSGLKPTCDCSDDGGYTGPAPGSAAQLQADYYILRPAPPQLHLTNSSPAPKLNWFESWWQARFAPPKPISGGGWQPAFGGLTLQYVPSAKNDFAGQQIEAERKARGWQTFDDLISSMPYMGGAAAGGISKPIAKQAAKEAADAAALAAKSAVPQVGARLAEVSAAAFRAADSPASIFIKNKHLASAGGNQAKFRTDDISQVQEWVAAGLRKEGVVFRENSLDDTFQAIVPAGDIVGTKGQTNIRVIVSNDGRVINAFPVVTK